MKEEQRIWYANYNIAPAVKAWRIFKLFEVHPMERVSREIYEPLKRKLGKLQVKELLCFYYSVSYSPENKYARGRETHIFTVLPYREVYFLCSLVDSQYLEAFINSYFSAWEKIIKKEADKSENPEVNPALLEEKRNALTRTKVLKTIEGIKVLASCDCFSLPSFTDDIREFLKQFLPQQRKPWQKIEIKWMKGGLALSLVEKIKEEAKKRTTPFSLSKIESILEEEKRWFFNVHDNNYNNHTEK